MNEQRKKAERLLELHHADKLLILPNIWDVVGAKLLESQGFEAIATASASVALSRGFEDNEAIDFSSLLVLFKAICASTPLPVTTDIERGYAGTPDVLEENIKNLIKAGVVGINIEDSNVKGEDLEPLEVQCEKIRLIRKVSDQMGVPLVINARTDVFLMKEFAEDRLVAAMARGQQYKEAGADCFYPILCPNEALDKLIAGVDLPINVLAQNHSQSISKLEQLGVSRLSFGPAVLRLAVMKMKEVFESVQQGMPLSTIIDEQLITSKDILEIVKS